MVIDVQVIGIYLGMVLFGLIAYAFIIPYFVARKVRGILQAGIADDMLTDVMKKQVPVIIQGLKDWAASEEGRATINNLLVEEFPKLLTMEIQTDDGKTMPLPNYLASVVWQNIYMQFLNFKKEVGQQIEQEAGPAPMMMTLAKKIIPKKYHEVIDKYAADYVAQYMQARGQQNQQQQGFSLGGH